MEDQVYRQLYEVENEHWWFVARKEILLRYLDARLPLRRDARLLDVGCGTGTILESFSRRYHAFGTDVAPQAIEFCRQRGLTELHLGRLEEYPRSEPFDILTMLDMLEHVEDDGGLLRAAHRLLRPGGHLLIAVPAFPSLWSKHDEILHHKRRYTRGTLRRVVEGAGFAVEHLTFFNFFLFPVAWAKRAAARAAGSRKANDLDIPSRILNAGLREIFRLERGILPHTSLPFGLSLLCLARKAAGE
jgi:SAM-dependent methyltransferase